VPVAEELLSVTAVSADVGPGSFMLMVSVRPNTRADGEREMDKLCTVFTVLIKSSHGPRSG
jgi:hypothetical protein